MRMRPVDRPPVAIFTQSATSELMLRSGASWPAAHSNPFKMAALASAQADILGFESVRAPFDVTAEAERMGCFVDIGNGTHPPVVRSSPFRSDPTIGLATPSDLPSPEEFVSSGRISAIIESISILSKTHGEDYPVIAGVTGPLTTLGQMLGTENMVMGTLVCPEKLFDWGVSLEPLFKEYVQCLSDAGADVVQMSEASASPDLIEPAMFDTLAGVHLKCLSSVKGAASSLHICGNAIPILDNMVHTKVDGISLESAVDPFEAKAIIGDRAALIGNVGAVTPLMSGIETDVANAADRCIDAGFNVIAPGCGLPLSTPNSNLLALVSAVKDREYRCAIDKKDDCNHVTIT